MTDWDNTGAIFGSKYKGWYLVISNAAGEVVCEKNNVQFLEPGSPLSKTEVGLFYNRKLEPVPAE